MHSLTHTHASCPSPRAPGNMDLARGPVGLGRVHLPCRKPRAPGAALVGGGRGSHQEGEPARGQSVFAYNLHVLTQPSRLAQSAPKLTCYYCSSEAWFFSAIRAAYHPPPESTMWRGGPRADSERPASRTCLLGLSFSPKQLIKRHPSTRQAPRTFQHRKCGHLPGAKHLPEGRGASLDGAAGPTPSSGTVCGSRMPGLLCYGYKL